MIDWLSTAALSFSRPKKGLTTVNFTSKLVRCVWVGVAIVACYTTLGAQPANLSEYMLLVIGPNSKKIDPVEAAVVKRLQVIRQQANYRSLAMATMHFDRPQEASYAGKVLGIRKEDLVCVCLAKTDPRTKQPIQRVYALSQVTPENLVFLETTLQNLTKTSLKLPSATATAGGINPNTTQTSGWTPEPGHTPLRGGQVYSWEGVLAVARQSELLSASMWETTKNQPTRSDMSDNPCRQALLGVAESTRLLRIAVEEGQTNPKDRLQRVLRNRDMLRRAEPQYFLPPAVRPSIPTLLESLDQVERIYWQLNP
jgi:hypothetical protein